MTDCKVALVTGAGRGIGREIALELGRRGFAVVASARSVHEIRSVAEAVRGGGGEAESVPCDVSQADDVEALFGSVRSRFGRLDLLVNNAGIGQFRALEQTDEALWDSTLATNLKGAFLCMRQAAPLMEEGGGGLVVNIASIVAVRGFAFSAAYTASKAGLLGMSRCLREELRKRGIRVAVVMPGATDSPFWDGVEGDWDRSKMIAPAEVARIVGEIASQPPGVLTEEVIVMPSGGAL